MENKNKRDEDRRKEDLGSPQKDVLGKQNKDLSKGGTKTDADKKKKTHHDDEVNPKDLTEPITEKVKKKIPQRRNLGPSGQDWDV